MTDRKRKVLGFFNRSNPRSEFEMAKKLRHPLTGLWLTEGADFKDWLATPNSSLWLTGIPGAGKSVLAGATIAECLHEKKSKANPAVAYFICTHRDVEAQEPSNILSSIAV